MLLFNRVQGPYQEMHLELWNKHFPYGPRLIRGILYTFPNKPVKDETSQCQSVVYCDSALPDPYTSSYANTDGLSHNQIAELFLYFNQYTIIPVLQTHVKEN